MEVKGGLTSAILHLIFFFFFSMEVSGPVARGLCGDAVCRRQAVEWQRTRVSFQVHRV